MDVFYVIRVEGGIYPYQYGPFMSESKQTEVAQQKHKESTDNDAIFWLNVKNLGFDNLPDITIGSYGASFFTEWKEGS
jgi:hypothetical protein